MLFSSAGKAVRFQEEQVRPMSRTARGVRGIKMPEGHHVVSLIIPQEGGVILTASEHGYGKRTAIDEFPAYSVAVRALSPCSAPSETVIW